MFTQRARAAWPAATPLAILVTLVALGTAACGNTHSTAENAASSPSNTSRSPVTVSPVTVSPSAGAGGASSSLPAPVRTPTPPPRGPVPVIPVTTSCTGWPSAPGGKLTASFTPVSVLRCVTSYTSVSGKGSKLTATLERASTGLGPLASALRAPSAHRRLGIMCPMYAMAPPQIVLADASGKTLRPVFPVTECGQIQPQVLATLRALHWQTVSQHVLP